MLETFKLCLHITRRNWIVYRKDLIANISPTLVEPFVMILSLGVGLGTFVPEVQGRTYSVFLAPGLAVSTALFTSFFESSYGFYVRLTFENIFKAMLTTPIGAKEVIFGEFVWLAIKGSLMFSIVALVLMCFGLSADPRFLLLGPLVGALIALACGAIGLLATSYVNNINQFQSIYAFLISPLYFFSGIFFPVEQMPKALQIVAQCQPLYHGVKLAQSLFWAENVAKTFLIHGSILAVFAFLLCLWAYFRIKKLLRTT